MTEDEFVQRAFEIAERGGLTVEVRRPGKSICFNSNSGKWLNEGHLRSLFPMILEPGISDTQVNRMIEDVAPGRPCTHVGMRSILQKLQSEAGSVSGLVV